MSKLIDLGEREILKQIIPRFADGAGDDCAIIQTAGGHLVVTTDPVPPPAAAAIGRDDDPFWMGWLLVTINVSDLAAAGAVPLGFLAAIECESERTTESFERLLEGIRASCAAAQIAYVGGNLREAGRLSAVGTAIGICDSYHPLTRVGARDGDSIVSIGQGGAFWRDALRLLDGKEIGTKNNSPVFRPISQIGFVHRLAREHLVGAAMDNSDGLLPSLSELASKNNLGVILDLDALTVPGLTSEESGDAARYWLGWGDWNVIVAVSPAHEGRLFELANTSGASAHRIGCFTAGHHGVVLQRGENIAPAPRLESERFARDSWMLKGIGEYVRMLKEVSLP
ncbi:thiamine-monophosphate kinase [Bradyrhizobium huanghuaihaiense]|uniref:Thiamine-monophosphate kinase n=1 Tax=Bradyrhizobium huanghuaihaiense TaxID=990078 RepID=A0A562QUM7_9BRAD|nr:thiamine-phosphate kinase [Bradyrhizobium huanghuaihaiense]TWI60475.1 thiamine-monophosphate kinase [Bradyrhizobium huanghuaihaiense]